MSYSPKVQTWASAKNTTSALRSFLRYAQDCGVLDQNLSAAVPTVADWSLANIPRGLSREQVNAVLACCNRQTAIGRRHYAVLLLLARLGLRAAGWPISILTTSNGPLARFWSMARVERCVESPCPTMSAKPSLST